MTATDLLFQYAGRREAAVKANGTLFAHYTSAQVASQILMNGNIWLRNAAVMNDFLEVQFGRKCLQNAIAAHGIRLKNALDRVHPGVMERSLTSIQARDFFNHHQTYLTSLCEHGASDDMGRLSMWRAYGGTTAGTALIFKHNFLDLDSSPLQVWSSPVLYGEASYVEEFSNLVTLMENHPDIVAELSASDFGDYLYNALQFSILSCKHQGFREENEWRLIHSPSEGGSSLVPFSVEIVRGQPEIVHHLPIDKSDALPGLQLTALLDRVIIGPCEHPIQVAMTFEKILGGLGFENPGSLIRISDIPLRQRG